MNCPRCDKCLPGADESHVRWPDVLDPGGLVFRRSVPVRRGLRAPLPMALAGALLAPSLVGSAGTASAATAISADRSLRHDAACFSGADGGAQSGRGGASFYAGPSASSTYDELFRRSFPVPHLDTHVPQGMTLWRNWDGKGNALALIGMYRDGARSLLVALDPSTGEHRATVEVRAAHLGGIAVSGKWLFAQDAAHTGRELVRRYRLDFLAAAVHESQRTGRMPFLAHLGGTQEIHGADYMAVRQGRIWSGRYREDAPDRMYEYLVAAAGRLRPTGASAPVPPRTQGVLVGDRAFVFVTFNHSRPGVMVVAERSGGSGPRAVCFLAPSMGQNMIAIGDRALLIYESGSYRYPAATNRIPRAHQASVRRLEAVLDR